MAIHDYVIQRLAALHQRPDIRQSPVARDTLVHMVGLGKGISLMSEAIIAMPFPHLRSYLAAKDRPAPKVMVDA